MVTAVRSSGACVQVMVARQRALFDANGARQQRARFSPSPSYPPPPASLPAAQRAAAPAAPKLNSTDREERGGPVSTAGVLTRDGVPQQPAGLVRQQRRADSRCARRVRPRAGCNVRTRSRPPPPPPTPPRPQPSHHHRAGYAARVPPNAPPATGTPNVPRPRHGRSRRRAARLHDVRGKQRVVFDGGHDGGHDGLEARAAPEPTRQSTPRHLWWTHPREGARGPVRAHGWARTTRVSPAPQSQRVPDSEFQNFRISEFIYKW